MEKNIYNKLYQVQKEVGAITKDQENDFHHNTYFDINKLINQLLPIFQKYNLLLLQPIEDGKQYSRIMNLDDGEIVESFLELPMDLNAQKICAAITYYRRYTLVSL